MDTQTRDIDTLFLQPPPAGLFEKSGSFYSWKGERIAQGRDKACAYVAEHPDVAQEVRLTLLEARKAENAALGAQPLPAAQAA